MSTGEYPFFLGVRLGDLSVGSSKERDEERAVKNRLRVEQASIQTLEVFIRRLNSIQ